MSRKLITWLITLTAGMYVLPFSSCASHAVNGVIQSLKPCDILNCQNPRYVNPCDFINCFPSAYVPTYVTSTTTGTTGTTTTGTTAGGGAGLSQ